VGCVVGYFVGAGVGIGVGAYVGFAVGSFVGAEVGVFVGAFVGKSVLHTLFVHILYSQSESAKHLLPGTHLGQPLVPPQSMSVSRPLWMPSTHAAGVGAAVGAGVGVPVVG
jgi:hypothetical protein